LDLILFRVLRPGLLAQDRPCDLPGIHRVCFFGRDFGVLGLGLSGMGARVASSRRDDVAVALDRASMGAQRRL
jgi:hypothetical protein